VIDIDNMPKRRIRNPGRKLMAAKCAGKLAPSSGVHELDGNKVSWSRTVYWDRDAIPPRLRSKLTERPFIEGGETVRGERRCTYAHSVWRKPPEVERG
jgi:hypothetical protein